MILPVIAYGDPVLRKVAVEITKDYPDLQSVIDNMFETMHKALGVGLAAPQVGKSIRLFIVETKPFTERGEDDEGKGTIRRA
jgi:peptide deformylase